MCLELVVEIRETSWLMQLALCKLDNSEVGQGEEEVGSGK